MTVTQTEPIVTEADRIKLHQVERQGTFMMFFKTKWWETIHAERLGTDIHIRTDHQIENIYLNGEKLTTKEELLELEKGV